MRRFALLAACCVASAGAAASDSCVMHIARLLSAGETVELAALFATSGAKLVLALEDLARDAGLLSDLRETPAPAFTRFRRHSVPTIGDVSSYDYQGHWIDARARDGSAVQLHLAVQPGSTCKLLALHLDRPAN